MTSHSGVTKQGGPRFRFVGDVIAELKKVVWLNRREVVYLTALVLVVVIAVGLVLGLIDLAFGELVRRVLLGE